MSKRPALASAVLLLAMLVALRLPGRGGEPRAAEAITLDFDTAAVGELPAGFSIAVTGGGGEASWSVVEDSTAPSGGKVLAQTSADRTSYRFPLCVYDALTAKDVTVSVWFKPVAGTVDQAAGLVARFKDKDNYYVVRANALEHNVRLYKVEHSKGQQLAGINMRVTSREWQILMLEVKSTHFRVLLSDAFLFEADDATFKHAGKVGLWTKADSVTYFDNLTIRPHDTR